MCRLVGCSIIWNLSKSQNFPKFTKFACHLTMLASHWMYMKAYAMGFWKVSPSNTIDFILSLISFMAVFFTWVFFSLPCWYLARVAYNLGDKVGCCIFWPAFGRCALQTLVRLCFFSIFCAKKLKKRKKNWPQNLAKKIIWLLLF